jgi:hypothetical protein
VPEIGANLMLPPRGVKPASARATTFLAARGLGWDVAPDLPKRTTCPGRSRAALGPFLGKKGNRALLFARSGSEGIEAAVRLPMAGSVSKEKAVPRIPGLKLTDDTIAGRYRVESLLGTGSSGFVVAARHVYLRRSVTLKILPLTTAAHHRAQKQRLVTAHQAASLRSPHVARMIDTGFAEDGTPFIATERLEGRTLADELEARGNLPADEAVRWILQACAGLAEAHAAGIVHGDLKPSNLFLAGPIDGPPEKRIVKLLDFGMAIPVDDGADDTSPWLASPAYLSPEQIRDPAHADARVDIWALGVILHQLVTGTLPFSADSIAGMVVAVASDEPEMLVGPDVPFELARVVRGCLAKDAERRPKSVKRLARALAPFAGAEGPTLAARVASASARPPPDRSTAAAPSETEARAPSVAAAPSRVEAKELAADIPTKKAVAWPRSLEAVLAALPFDGGAALRRRRETVIATVAAAAVIALIGFLAAESAPPEPLPTTVTSAEEPAPAPAVPESSPIPKALPLLAPEPREAPPPPAEPAIVHAPPPPAHARTATPAPKPPTAVERSSRRTEASTAATTTRKNGRDVATPTPSPKARPSLAVREDPYARPAPPPRPADRRKWGL